jgi:hypothetical protein
MDAIHKRSIVALALAGALSVGVGGALAYQDDTGYGTADRIQAGHGPGGPPAQSSMSSRQPESVSGVGRDYGSPALIQLGHGPGGPRAAQ